MSDYSVPDYLDAIPPPEGGNMEYNRNQALSLLAAYDYQLVIPPLAEYIETLTAGNPELDLKTFKLTDTLSGRTLGVRADQTPQIAARHTTGGIRRFCYCGPVLRTRPPKPWQSRESMQLGAELFGAPAPAGDWEIIQVAVATLRALGLADLSLDIGHAGLFLTLSQNLPADQQKDLMPLVNRRDSPAIRSLAADGALPADTAEHMLILASGCATAAKQLPQPSQPILTDLATIARQCAFIGIDANIDLSDLGSYDYHTGVVFTLYSGRQVAARGGRYQHKDGECGTGFSVDLRVNGLRPAPPSPPPVCVPLVMDDDAWVAAVQSLQATNRPIRFVYDTPTTPPALCSQNGKWVVQEA